MNDYLDRSEKLIGKEKIASFENRKIVVIGLGGVGGTALECLARSGFKNFVLIDCDIVDVSNLNRQILFTAKDVGKLKVDVAEEKLLSINTEFKIEKINSKIGETNLNEIIESADFIVDAIDYVPGKLDIMDFCFKNKIPFISSLGMGNRLDPEKVFITTLNKTENDPLARKIRYEAKQRNFPLKEIPVVFSSEQPILKDKKPASMMMVPSTTGLLIAKYVLFTIK